MNIWQKSLGIRIELCFLIENMEWCTWEWIAMVACRHGNGSVWCHGDGCYTTPWLALKTTVFPLHQVVEENPDPEMTLLYYLRNKSKYVLCWCNKIFLTALKGSLSCSLQCISPELNWAVGREAVEHARWWFPSTSPRRAQCCEF